MGGEKNLNVRAAVGMTAAAAVERAIKLTNEVGEIPGVALQNLVGNLHFSFHQKFQKLVKHILLMAIIFFLDVINSTKFIEKYGRDF